jgi:NADPH:quinone reductase-like Zn-dependent oxidoreductase
VITQAVRFHQTGGPDVLALEDVELPEPGPGEVRLRIEAIGLNRAEVMFRGGYYIEPVRTFPATNGYEASGVVEAVGSAMTGFSPGDAVSVVPAFSLNDYGTYARHANIPAAALVHRPDYLDAVGAASVWMQYLTAYGALIEVGGLRAGDQVLITAASSSVGIAAIQVANRCGATVIATTRSAAKAQALMAAGAAHVVVTGQAALAERVHELTGGTGVRLVFDAVAGPGLSDLVRAVATGGTVIVYGLLSGQPTPFATLEAGLLPVSLRTYTLFEITTDAGRLARAQQYVLAGLRSGAFSPVMDRTFELSEIAEAHRYMESNAQVGKIVVTVRN